LSVSDKATTAARPRGTASRAPGCSYLPRADDRRRAACRLFACRRRRLVYDLSTKRRGYCGRQADRPSTVGRSVGGWVALISSHTLFDMALFSYSLHVAPSRGVNVTTADNNCITIVSVSHRCLCHITHSLVLSLVTDTSVEMVEKAFKHTKEH